MGSLPLAIYRSATRIGEPAGPLLLAWRARRGKEDRSRQGERLGRPGRPRPAGRLAWLHGASVGEGNALLPLVADLVGRGFAVLVTTGTVTSSRVLAPRLPPGALHQFVPLDLPGAVRRFFDHWRPDVICIAESELWPNLVGEAKLRGVPAVLVNARMSERSFRRWMRFGSAMRAMLDGFALVLAQSAGDAARFTALGAPVVQAVGNIKFDVAPPTADASSLAELRAATGERPVWLAASTHAGEDALCCGVHRHVARTRPGLLTLIVPRQAERGPTIAEAARQQGLTAGLRSRGELPGPGTDIYVADTMGEMGLFLRLAPVVFMGKSLVPDGGGQNPIEPAKLGAAILHGPAIANFRDVFALFDQAGGARCVATADDLAEAVRTLLDDPAARSALAAAAAEVVAANAGSTARSLAAMAPILAAALRRPAA